MTDTTTGAIRATGTTARLGTLPWSAQTNGQLTSAERRQLLLPLVRTHVANAAGRTSMLLRVNSGRRTQLPDRALRRPSSALTRAAEQLAQQRLSPALLGHSYRCYLFGVALGSLEQIDVDRELLFAAAMLHDIGLATPTTGVDFTLTSARIALDVAETVGLSTAATDIMRTAITLHHSPDVTVADGPVAYLMSAGAAVDVIGLRAWQLPPEVVAAVVAQHPRSGFTREFRDAWATEAAAVPRGRARFLRRYGAFDLAVRLAPFSQEPAPPGRTVGRGATAHARRQRHLDQAPVMTTTDLRPPPPTGSPAAQPPPSTSRLDEETPMSIRTHVGPRHTSPQPAADPPQRRGRLGWIVAFSLAAGPLVALLLVAAPFTPVTEAAITGAVLCGFAVGWAVLFSLSRRFTDRPQRWASIPALVTGVSGLLLLGFGSLMREVLSWTWPPVLVALVAWMVVRVRRDMQSRGGRVQLYLVFTVLAVAAVGGAWQTVSEATETNPYLSSGRLVDVGGHHLRLDCAGSGSPTVVLEPGAGGTSASMGWVAPAVAHQTRVCVYDRAGRGGSEAADGVQDGARIATDLHTLLHRAGVPGPYVLAGHSFGGLYVRIFAAHYPDEVAGLVLLDSTASAEPASSVVPSTGGGNSGDGAGRFATLASLSARVGLTRLVGDLLGGTLPARSEEQLRYDTAQASTVRSVIDEYQRGGAAARQAASLRDFGDKPLFVLTAGKHPASWMTAQKQTTTLSTNSEHQVVDGATHSGLLNEPRNAAHVTRAVLAVITSIRDNKPLTTDQ